MSTRTNLRAAPAATLSRTVTRSHSASTLMTLGTLPGDQAVRLPENCAA